MQVRRPATLRAWLTAYAAATSTTTRYGSLLDAAMSAEGDKPAKATTMVYRDVLSQLWLLDPVPGWLPTRSHVKRLTQLPKHHLADPALAVHLLGIDEGALLKGQATGPVIPPDGTLLEVKLSATPDDRSVEHLRWLRSQLGEDLLDAAVITTGRHAYRRKDGIAVIPAALLGP